MNFDFQVFTKMALTVPHIFLTPELPKVAKCRVGREMGGDRGEEEGISLSRSSVKKRPKILALRHQFREDFFCRVDIL